MSKIYILYILALYCCFSLYVADFSCQLIYIFKKLNDKSNRRAKTYKNCLFMELLLYIRFNFVCTFVSYSTYFYTVKNKLSNLSVSKVYPANFDLIGTVHGAGSDFVPHKPSG